MGPNSPDGKPFQLFADLLDYPGEGLLAELREREDGVSALSPEAWALLAEFRALVQTVPLGRLQEIYSGIFDLAPDCCPYVGHHLFGESYKRSVFLVELKKRYRDGRFDSGEELPDHLAVMLRFLGMCESASAVRELIEEAMLPAVSHMLGEQGGPAHDDARPHAELEGGGAPLPAVPEDAPPAPRSGSGDHPYRGVLRALQLVLRQAAGASQTVA